MSLFFLGLGFRVVQGLLSRGLNKPYCSQAPEAPDTAQPLS